MVHRLHSLKRKCRECEQINVETHGNQQHNRNLTVTDPAWLYLFKGKIITINMKADTQEGPDKSNDVLEYDMNSIVNHLHIHSLFQAFVNILFLSMADRGVTFIQLCSRI